MRAAGWAGCWGAAACPLSSHPPSSPFFFAGGMEKLGVAHKLPKAYSTGFVGCIRDVVVDRQELHLVEDALNNPTILHCSAK